MGRCTRANVTNHPHLSWLQVQPLAISSPIRLSAAPSAAQRCWSSGGSCNLDGRQRGRELLAPTFAALMRRDRDGDLFGGLRECFGLVEQPYPIAMRIFNRRPLRRANSCAFSQRFSSSSSSMRCSRAVSRASSASASIGVMGDRRTHARGDSESRSPSLNEILRNVHLVRLHPPDIVAIEQPVAA